MTRRRKTWSALLAGAALGALCALSGDAQADCIRAPIVTTSFDDVVACTGPGEQADGTVAVSAQGGARASGALPAAAVSGTGHADRSILCASGTGRAGGPHSDLENQCTISVSAAGADGEQGPASSGFLLSIAGTGSARGPVAVSGTGDSNGQLVSVSGTGRAGGDTYTGEHPSPYVAVSGCSADHAAHDEEHNGQVLTTDPTGVHVNADPDDILDPDGRFDGPHDVSTGEVGTAAQGVTCAV